MTMSDRPLGYLLNLHFVYLDEGIKHVVKNFELFSSASSASSAVRGFSYG